MARLCSTQCTGDSGAGSSAAVGGGGGDTSDRGVDQGSPRTGAVSIKEHCLSVSLSLRNRLYCGESLLVAGASSFLYSPTFEMLLYGTLGTRPTLHFCSYDRLAALDPLQHADAQEIADCAEPRPLERGARLVTAGRGDSKVVTQLPRGNLECFEPRPLILMRAQHLMHRGALLDCLILLRKQRVDLNYIVDFSPRIFFRHVGTFVRQMLECNPDLIALMITALEPVDTSHTKYTLRTSTALLNAEAQTLAATAHYEATLKTEDGAPNTEAAVVSEREVKENERISALLEDFTGESKVNKVCMAVREVLLELIESGTQSATEGSTAAISALQPALCTFARHRPPQLVGALSVIRACCERTFRPNLPPSSTSQKATPAALTAAFTVPLESTSSSSSKTLNSALANASIKYLAFLAEGSQLFEAALGACDFEMARAVARQCQMDPKAYLPLIESFQSVARGSPAESVRYAVMQFKINVHLKRHAEAAHSGVAVLERFLQPEMHHLSASSSVTIVTTATLNNDHSSRANPDVSNAGMAVSKDSFARLLEDVMATASQLVGIVASESLHLLVLPRLSALFLAQQRHSGARIHLARVDSFCALRCPSVATLQRKFLSLTSDATSTDGSTRTPLAATHQTQTPFYTLCAALCDVRRHYGELSLKKADYGEAISCFLNLLPPDAHSAVKAARFQGNWRLALAIAGRFANPVQSSAGDDGTSIGAGATYEGEGEGAGSERESGLSPQRVAQEIVSEFREALEQGESFGTKPFNAAAVFAANDGQSSAGGEGVGGGVHNSSSGGGAPIDHSLTALSSFSPTGGALTLGVAVAEDKVLEAARLCVDYCADPEGAVSLLTTAQRWTSALELTVRFHRRDLQQEVRRVVLRIYSCIRAVNTDSYLFRR